MTATAQDPQAGEGTVLILDFAIACLTFLRGIHAPVLESLKERHRESGGKDAAADMLIHFLEGLK